jgi:predicted RNA-binding Zn ribbon-like protein
MSSIASVRHVNVSEPYAGPVRDEPLAVELHNTLYASGGGLVDGLADRASCDAWLTALDRRLPPGGTRGDPRPAELIALRHAVREAFHSLFEGRLPPRTSIEAINRSSTRAPRAAIARWRRDAPPASGWDFGEASRADVVLSALAADAIDLVTGPNRASLRVCGAPGCVLAFVKRHPRREWCSTACGNRVRQARHYRRHARGRQPLS